jgi:SlyX protein
MPDTDDSPDRIQQRLTDLEIKASYAEDTLDRLNDVIVRQQAQIDALLRELAALRQQSPAADAPAFRSLRDDLPPHY